MKGWLVLVLILFMINLVSGASTSLNGCSDLNTDKDCIEVYSCGIFDNANTYYLLMNNVNSDNSCFLIAESNIIFDLKSF